VAPRLVPANPELLVRVGQRPRAGEFPDRKWLSEPAYYRFDDARRRCGVLYAAEERRTCFYELLARFRTDPVLLEELRRLGSTDSDIATISCRWVDDRDVAQLRLSSPLHFLDMRAPESHQEVRIQLAHVLVELGLKDFDASDALGPQRTLTQEIAAWAYGQGWGGILYASRLDLTRTCWAIFERPENQVTVMSEQPVSAVDAELQHVLKVFRIQLE
jgi:hypothetical protein